MIELAQLPDRGVLLVTSLTYALIMFAGSVGFFYIASREVVKRKECTAKAIKYPGVYFWVLNILSFILFVGGAVRALCAGYDHSDYIEPISYSYYIYLNDNKKALPKTFQKVFNERFDEYLVTDDLITKAEFKILRNYVEEVKQINQASESGKKGEQSELELSTVPE